MQVGLFAKKVGMTQVFDESGTIFPVTILKAGVCKISQIKNTTSDGYNAVQVAYEEKKIDKLNKSIRGHLKKIGDQGFNSFGEFHVGNPDNFKLGQTLTVDTFTKGQKIWVTGKSIGKGFAGNQKRHNFSRGPMTHGSKNHRLPGSIGMGTTPGRVLPGKRMAGQLGNKITNIKKLKIVQVNAEENILVVKGSVPGKPGNLLSIIPSK